LKSGFSLEVFEKSQARSQRLTNYLTVYLQHLGPLHRTKTNELLEFLRNPDEGRTVVYFGLSYYGKPCGFSTLMLYPESSLGIIDHVAIAPTVRGYGAFFSFCELVAEYLERTRHAYNYVVVEIVLGDQPVTMGTTPLMLIRLSRFIGFRIANLPYYAQEPLIVRDKDSCRAALMIFAQPDKTEIGAEELITLLSVIYFKHYGEWYRRIMTPADFSIYENSLGATFDETETYIRLSKTIKINGMRNFDLPYVVEPGSRPNASLFGYAVLVALPSILTIAIAIEQETRLTIGVAAITALLFGLLLVPKIHKPLLKFFQLER
jgi:hypothetical protein